MTYCGRLKSTEHDVWRIGSKQVLYVVFHMMLEFENSTINSVLGIAGLPTRVANDIWRIAGIWTNTAIGILTYYWSLNKYGKMLPLVSVSMKRINA